jgi:hypothetical protein
MIARHTRPPFSASAALKEAITKVTDSIKYNQVGEIVIAEILMPF